MIARIKPGSGDGGGNYFASPHDDLSFIPSGCKILDLALGGGWAEGRIANIVGDKSSGKTLLCIEAAANFALQYPKGKVLYREAEAAFDKGYAEALGMPLSRVEFGDPIETIEDLFEDLEQSLTRIKVPVLYIVDSLDALSDRAELEREIDQGTYGAEKAKKLSQLFRRLTQRMSRRRMTLIVVSQVRSKIGMTIGRSTTRSGGRALDFYASQVLYLAHAGSLLRTISNVKRVVGVKIHAKVDKNKIALPLREADFSITFGYGIDDILASLMWLKSAKALSLVGVKAATSDNDLRAISREAVQEGDHQFIERLQQAVTTKWYDIERGFLPTKRKYT